MIIIVFSILVGLVSVGLAFVPWRPPALRMSLLYAQGVASTVAILALPGNWIVWFFYLAPGGVLAVGNATQVLLAERARKQGRGPSG